MPKVRSLVPHFTVLLASLFAVTAHASSYRFRLGAKTLICVPRLEVPDFNRDLIPESRTLTPKAAPQQLVTVHYDASDILRSIPTFRTNSGYSLDESPNVLSVVVYFINENYKNIPMGAAAGPDVGNIWNRTSDCKIPFIENVPGTNTFLARCDRENFWHILLDRYPDGGKKPRDVYNTVLATCTHTSISFGIHKGAELEDCIRRIIYGNYRIDYQFQIQNAGLILEMDNFVESRVRAWEHDCEQ